jgi:hypothetical protein
MRTPFLYAEDREISAQEASLHPVPSTGAHLQDGAFVLWPLSPPQKENPGPCHGTVAAPKVARSGDREVESSLSIPFPGKRVDFVVMVNYSVYVVNKKVKTDIDGK